MKRTWLGAAAMFATALPLAAQNRKDEPPEPPKIVERYEPHDWTLSVTVSLRPDTHTNVKSKMPEREKFDFTSAAVVFPLVKESSSHLLRVAERDVDGKLKLNDRPILEHPTEILADYPAGTKLAKWGMKGWVGEEVEIQIKIPVTSWNTKFDETLAGKLKWPDNWGAAQSALEPEYFIDMGMDGPYDMAPVKDLLKKWCGGKDPKALSPVQLAKFLCGEVIKHVQTNGNGMSYARTGEMEGIALQGAPKTAETGKGSEYDAVCLLVAMYRAAGLPARSVIAFDAGDSKDGRFLAKKGSNSSIRAWVEFALIDPNKTEPIWVPVDVVRIRKSSTRPPPLDRPWPFFGTHKELAGTIPFAYQWFPPSKGVVSYGSAAFFGWMVTPKPPEHVVQALRFDAITTPKRGDDKKEEKKKGPYGK